MQRGRPGCQDWQEGDIPKVGLFSRRAPLKVSVLAARVHGQVALLRCGTLRYVPGTYLGSSLPFPSTATHSLPSYRHLPSADR